MRLVTATRELGGLLANVGAHLRRLLEQPRSVWCLPLLGMLLCSSAVGSHLVFDDYVLGLTARCAPRVVGLSCERWDLFSFTNGERAANRVLMQQGLLLPWWSDQELKVAFYRPLSSLTHRLDFALWPDVPRAMYWQSLIWYGLTIALVACLFRRLESSPWMAALAALLFALDDRHGPVVAWLSNRNALIATAFGLLALISHHEWRARGARAFAWGGALAWLFALAAGEFAAGTLAYLAAYALLLDRASPLRRMASLGPYALVLAAWSVVYFEHGAGVRGSGLYVSPWLDFSRFACIAPLRLLGLLAATLGPLPAELLLLGRREDFALWAVLAGLVLAAAACALWLPLRRDRTARFWLAGMLLALAPVTTSFPSDRLALFASVGSAGLLARVVAPLFEPGGRQALGGARAGLSIFFAATHLVLAPLCLPLRAAQMQLVGQSLERATAYLDEVRGLSQRTLVIVNAPLDVFASYLQAERAWKHLPRATRSYWLTSAGSKLRVTRADANTLVVERAGGFLSTPLERHYRARADELRPGEQVRLGPMLATIISSAPGGEPLAVSFRFTERLESDSYLFMVWRDGRYRPLALDTLAQPLELPAEDLGRILVHAALGRP
jgi:hypothetical protein